MTESVTITITGPVKNGSISLTIGIVGEEVASDYEESMSQPADSQESTHSASNAKKAPVPWQVKVHTGVRRACPTSRRAHVAFRTALATPPP